MIKHTLKGLAAALCALALTSCSCNPIADVSRQDDISSKPEASSSTSENLTKDNITLTVWESNNGPDKWIQLAAKEFSAIYPNISIEFCNVEIGAALAELENPQSEIPAPDLFGAPHDNVGALVEKGLILPTDNPSHVAINTLYSTSKALMYNDIMYGYPTSCETYAMFYNKALINEADLPQTWDELIEWSKGFSKDNPGKYGLIYHSDTVYYNAMLMSNNGNRLLQSEQSTGLDTEAALDGALLLQKIADILPSNVNSFTFEDYDNLFLQGDAAIMINGPWLMSSAEVAKLDYGIVPLPAFEKGGEPAYSFSGVRGMFVSSNSKHPAEAAAFARFLINEDMQKLRQEITLALPSVNISINDEKTNGFLEQLEYSYPMPNSPSAINFWIYGKSFSKNIIDGADPQSELDKFQALALNGDETPTSLDIEASASSGE